MTPRFLSARGRCVRDAKKWAKGGTKGCGGRRASMWGAKETGKGCKTDGKKAERGCCRCGGKGCRQNCLNAPDESRRKLAATPWLFRETNNPKNFVVVPATSSECRKYIPMGFLDSDTIVTNAILIIPGASLYHFGVLTSSVHNA